MNNALLENIRILWDYLLYEGELEKSDIIIGFGSNDISVANRATKLFNDGKSPTDDNITIIWLEDRVKIIISGEEQSDYIQEMIY